jgi:hypothetical protein
VCQPRCAARLARGTWVRSMNVACVTHVGVDTTTGRDTVVVLRDQDQWCLGASCMTRNNDHPSRHRTMFLSMPPCSASPPSMPPARMLLTLSLSQVGGKRSPVAGKRHHPTSPSRMPRRAPRVARRCESGALSGLRSRLTMMTTTRKRTAPTWSAS